MKTQHIHIPKEELEEMNAVISGKAGIVGENTVARYTANFGDGIEADIKVCGVKETHDAEEDECTPYVDAVLFENGSEIGCIEPSFDTLEGEYLFYFPNFMEEMFRVILQEK